MLRKPGRFVCVLVVIVLAGIAIPFTRAQEGPLQVGLRPDAPPYAVHGPYWVGTQEVVIGEGSERPLNATIWYPALNPEGLEEVVSHVIEYPPLIPQVSISGHALLDAPPDGSQGPYPLVLFSHGAFGWRYSSLYLIEHLASQGFVVISADHAGDTASNLEDEGAFARAHVSRPRDITQIIDFAAALTAEDGLLPSLIDIEHVAVVGHSSGAWTALLAGGARRDYRALTAWCAENPDDMWVCGNMMGQENLLAELLGLDAVPEGLWPAVGDARVDAIVPLAPGNATAFGPEGLAAIRVPALVMIGTHDMFLPYDSFGPPTYEAISGVPKAFVSFEAGDHNVFGDDCSLAPWLIDLQFYWLCSDPVWDMNRSHDLVNHFTTAFLLATLKNDADAAAALAPEAVAFPGITYTAQGF